MKFSNTRKTFTSVCSEGTFNRQVVLDALEWCANNLAGWDYGLEATTSYAVHDFGEGFEERGRVWTFKLLFEREDDALAFRLALDGILAEGTC
jgi:hypothetical protein